MMPDERAIIAVSFSGGTNGLRSITSSIASSGGFFDLRISDDAMFRAIVDRTTASVICQHGFVLVATDFEPPVLE